MIVQAVRIEESVDIETMKSQTSIVFRLPTGKYFRATIADEEGMKVFVEAAAESASGRADQPELEEQDIPQPPLPSPPQQAAAVNRKVLWVDLPPATLSPLMKAAFTKLGVAESLTIDEVHRLVDNITENFGPSDWEAVHGGMVEAAQPPSLPTPAPAKRPSPSNTLTPNKVVWADGSPIVAGQGTPFRTVPRDEYGYPMVSGEADPGEVTGTPGQDADEDGVNQF